MVKTSYAYAALDDLRIMIEHGKTAIYGECQGLEKRSRLKCVFEQYVAAISGLGIVTHLMIGTPSDEAVGYVWNILKEEYDIGRKISDQHLALIDLGAKLEEELEDLINLYVSYVNPDDVESLEQHCREEQIDFESMPIG